MKNYSSVVLDCEEAEAEVAVEASDSQRSTAGN